MLYDLAAEYTTSWIRRPSPASARARARTRYERKVAR